MDWIIHKKDGHMCRVQCPKCRNLFLFDYEGLDKRSRRYWKCCPICGDISEIEDKLVEIPYDI